LAWVGRAAMEERLSSVKRGDWVCVEDAVAFDSCVVVVIGVTAVIRVPRNGGAGDTIQAVEIRCCTPRSGEIATGGERRPEVHATRRSFGVAR
jgi:hypothetical protein